LFTFLPSRGHIFIHPPLQRVLECSCDTAHLLNLIEEYCATSLSNSTLPRTAGDPYPSYPILHLNPIPSITCMLSIGHHHIIEICKNIASSMSLMHPSPS
jgi:hypothetical protein